MNSICIVIPYFGKWPAWMPYYLETCRFNNTVNWIFYTDCGAPENTPSNVKVIDSTYRDYCDLVSQRLGIAFYPENSYKLCDIKPLLGYIHADVLQGYDFWGFGDIDLIYGDLRAYFNQSRLNRRDLFSTHARRVSGHLCLIRNTDQMRTAFRRVRNWKFLISKPEHAAFDEKAFSKLFLRHKNSPAIVRFVARLLDPWLRKAEFAEAYTTPNAKLRWVDGTKNFPVRWFWCQGALTNDIDTGRVFPYFHFMVWKKFLANTPDASDINTAECDSANAFCVSVQGVEKITA